MWEMLQFFSKWWWEISHIHFSIFLSGLYYEIQNNDIRMEMAFHEGFKQLQARVLQAQVTKEKSMGTIEYVEEGRNVESSLGPWGITDGSSTTAIKAEAPAGRTGEWRSWMAIGKITSLMNSTKHIIGTQQIFVKWIGGVLSCSGHTRKRLLQNISSFIWLKVWSFYYCYSVFLILKNLLSVYL